MRRPSMLAPGLLLLAACAAPPGPRLQHPDLDEASGLTASRRYPGVFWTHNDSGGDARLFAVTADGRTVGTVDVEGATATDWESITTDDAGHLYVGDIGNNWSTRRDLVVYRLREPDPRRGGAVKVDRAIRFRFPDQTAFPDPARGFDCEALFWAPHPQTGQGTLYTLTKRRSDRRTSLYRFDDLSGGAEVVLTRVGEPFEVGGDPARYGGMVTAADATPDGRQLVVLTYHALFVFERPSPTDDRYLTRLVNRVELDQDVTVQAEAVAWDGDEVVIANEQRRMFRLRRPRARRTAAFPTARDLR
ncbi:MAG: hypothetical protein KC583_23120 [Myxococcales bacterium]|nr:hypothetical protein [Myxococcales bacterium]